ncbi:MAG: ATP-binding protein [Candidatus Altiarchaeota archaeon]|nr:ATP-binding protein [Candidatus Altiarchaeota archaeon]
MDIGKVISTQNGPSPSFFAFVISKSKRVSKDQFVRVNTEEGLMIAMVENVIKTNRYYANPETVVESDNLEQLFQVDEWEFLVAEAIPLGVISGNLTVRPTIPPSPGDVVEVVSEDVLSNFLGFNNTGLNIGDVIHHNVPVLLGLGKTFQKHLAILAMSGAGKSYLTSVLIEEVLSRSKKDGRVASVIFDVHGEYAGFAEKPPKKFKNFSDKVNSVIKIKIPVPELSAREISVFTTLTHVQIAELDKIIRELNGQIYDFKDLVSEVSSRSVPPKTKAALVRWLNGLHATGLFSSTEDLITKRPGEKEEHHKLIDLIKPGYMTVFDLSENIQKRVRDLIVLWLSRELFKLRRFEKIPPLVMFVEEAHNFIPEGASQADTPTLGIFQTIAREGRKFLCSLVIISQRPIKLSTTVLSQCNTHIIMRITNPYDLNHIGQSSEGVTNNTLKSLTSLQVGEALVVGEAVRYPVFLKVRERVSWEKKSSNMELQAIEFEAKSIKDEKIINDAKDAFL